MLTIMILLFRFFLAYFFIASLLTITAGVIAAINWPRR